MWAGKASSDRSRGHCAFNSRAAFGPCTSNESCRWLISTRECAWPARALPRMASSVERSPAGASSKRSSGPSQSEARAPVLTARQGVMEEGSPRATSAACCAVSSPQKLRRVALGKGCSQALSSTIEARSFRIIKNRTGHLHGDVAARLRHKQGPANARAPVCNHGECDRESKRRACVRRGHVADDLHGCGLAGGGHDLGSFIEQRRAVDR